MEHHNYTTLIFYAFLTAIAIFLIILLKSYTYTGISFVYVYTIFITTFMFSRIIGSFFYGSQNNFSNKKYEPRVSFVIPCKNEQEAIYKTIRKCAEVDYNKKKIEVVVINDGSTDNTLQEMYKAKKDYREVKIKIINWKKNKGKRHGMAKGFRSAKGEIVIQLDSDSFIDKDALKHIIPIFLDKNIGAVVGHSEPANKDENIITKIQTPYYFMSFRALKATESIFNMVFCCSGCFSAYRRKYVLPVLGELLNEKFLGRKITYGDDRALTNQILKAGYKAVYSYEAKAYTIIPNTLKTFLKQQVRWKKGWFINSLKALKFIFKQDKFVAVTYLIPLIILTIIAPFIAFKALIIDPLFFGKSPVFYVSGIMLVSLLLFSHYKLYNTEKYGAYMFLWSILNMTILSYIILYAVYDLKNMNWGTR